MIINYNIDKILIFTFTRVQFKPVGVPSPTCGIKLVNLVHSALCCNLANNNKNDKAKVTATLKCFYFIIKSYLRQLNIHVV